MFNQVLYYVGIFIALIMGITSLVLFFKFHIVHILDDLSGGNAKREISNIKSISAGETIILRNENVSQLGHKNIEQETKILCDMSEPIEFELIINEVYVHSDICRL